MQKPVFQIKLVSSTPENPNLHAKHAQNCRIAHFNPFFRSNSLLFIIMQLYNTL